MLGNFTSYSKVSVTPTSNQTLLQCNNPLGVIPKLVHITTTDRSSSYDCIFDYLLTPECGAVLYEYQSANAYQYGVVSNTDSPTAVRAYYLAADTIVVQRPTSGTTRWRAGITYDIHIYA